MRKLNNNSNICADEQKFKRHCMCKTMLQVLHANVMGPIESRREYVRNKDVREEVGYRDAKAT